jgi:translation initiation factor IF-3
MIRIPQVRVVDEEGSQLGVMPTAQALALAQERGYDLVEVAPMAAPPVVRFLDFGQFKYEATKREKEAKRKQRSVTFKEVRLKPKIATGDFDTRVRRAIQFLEEGDRLKVAVQFRGRELTHPEIGRNLLARFSERIKDHGVVERAPLLEGKSMHITVASTHKPKVIEPTRHDDGGAPATDETRPATAATDEAKPAAAATDEAKPAPPVAAAAPVAARAEPAQPPAESTAQSEPPEAAAAAPVAEVASNAPARPAAARAKAPAPETAPEPTAAPAPAETSEAATSTSSAPRAAAKRAPRAARSTEGGAKATAKGASATKPTAKAKAKPTAASAATTGE